MRPFSYYGVCGYVLDSDAALAWAKRRRCLLAGYCGVLALTVTDTFNCSSLPPMRRPRTGAAAS